MVAQRSVAASGRGYAQALRFADQHAAGVRVWAIEGAGHFGAGLARHLSGRGETVLEAGRSPRGERRLQGKDDSLDATRAARAALVNDALGVPRAGQRREAVRLLLVARRGAVEVRRRALVQLRSVIVTAPDRLREELQALPERRLLERCSHFRRSSSLPVDELAAKVVLRTLARRIEAATAEANELERAYSDDRGATWTVNELAAFNPSFIDRPWLAVYPSKVSANQDKVYVAYHDFTVSQINVAASSDGGQTFGPSVDVFAADPLAQSQTFCNSIPSGLEVDPETGEVYAQWITAGPVQNAQGCDLTQNQNFHEVWIAHSAGAVGTGPATVTTWDDHQVFDGPETTNTDKIFAALAVDDSGVPGTSGNVYSVFPDNLAAPDHFDIWFTHSSDRGTTWPPPVKVNSDKGTHYFPWIAAGSSGRVDFTWLNSPDYTPTDAEQSPWYVTFAQTTNGTSATPKFQQTSASSNVMHVGGICTNGIFCTITGGNRDLADSISIAIDRGGSAALAWTDQGRILGGPTHITYGCNTSQQTADIRANPGYSCKGPAGPR